MRAFFCFLFIATLVCTASAKAGKAVVPGKSLGDISIGDERSLLVKRGFSIDETRELNKYLKKERILVRVENDHVVQIWFEGTDLTSLNLRGKKFPKANDSKSLKKFFKACELEVKGSGGVLIYCENRGIELAYSYSKEFQGLSIVTPSIVESIVGGSSAKDKF